MNAMRYDADSTFFVCLSALVSELLRLHEIGNG